MYENIIISRILDTRSTDILSNQGLTPNMFLNAEEEISFILDHNRKYNTIPDHTTFITKFPQFELYSSSEDERYIAERLKDSFIYPHMYKLLQEASKLVATDSTQALNLLEDTIAGIKNQVNLTSSSGSDIVKLAGERLEEIKRRSNIEGILGISTGVDLLDEITYGWLPNDFVTLFARTNQGKSWVSLFFGVSAWMTGKKVVYYSGEMDKLTVGFRFDNLYRHFKNSELMTGKVNQDEYEEYVDSLKSKSGFICVEPADFGGFPTVADLEKTMKHHKADILIIDQLSLMKARVTGSKTERYTSISGELVLLNKKLGKPIILVAQASRNSEKNKKDDMDTPELTDIEYSDALGQDSSKVFSFIEVDNIIKLSILKSRFGSKGGDVLLNWNKEEGYIRPLLQGTNTDAFGF